jgi:hypothetical protein
MHPDAVQAKQCRDRRLTGQSRSNVNFSLSLSLPCSLSLSLSQDEHDKNDFFPDLGRR